MHVLVAWSAMIALADSKSTAETDGGKIQGETKVMNITAWSLHVASADRASQLIIHELVMPNNDACKDDRQLAVKEEELVEGWARLRLMRRLVVSVTAVLPISLKVESSALDTLRQEPKPIRSREFLLTVIRVLAYIAVRTHLCLSSDNAISSYVDIKLWDVFSRFLEGYLDDTFFSSAGGKTGEPIEELSKGNEVSGSCETLVAVLYGNASFFEELWDPSWPFSGNTLPTVLKVMWPREVACVKALRIMIKWSSSRTLTGMAVDQSLQAGLLCESRRRTLGSPDCLLTACFAAAVEEDATIDQVRVWCSSVSPTLLYH